MSINIDTLFQKDAFKAIDPERLKIFKQFAGELEGKGPAEIVASYIKFSKMLPKDKPLSKEEQNAIVQTVRESLPEEDRQKLDGVMKMMEMMGKK